MKILTNGISNLSGYDYIRKLSIQEERDHYRERIWKYHDSFFDHICTSIMVVVINDGYLERRREKIEERIEK